MSCSKTHEQETHGLLRSAYAELVQTLVQYTATCIRIQVRYFTLDFEATRYSGK